MAKGKAMVTKKDAVSGAVAKLSGDLASILKQNAGAGLESIGAEGFALPFLKLIQSLSPERQKGEDQYIPGAEEGQIFDSVTRELFDGVQGVEVIPVHVRPLVIEWKPRAQGGGFVAEYATKQEAEEYATPGNELKDTITYTVLYRRAGTNEDFRPALLGMESTKLKVARNWNSQMNMLRVPVEINGEVQRVSPPIYMTAWRLTTVSQKNEKGKFFNYQITYSHLIEDSAVVETATKLREAVSERTLRGKDGDVEEPAVGEGADTSY